MASGMVAYSTAVRRAGRVCAFGRFSSPRQQAYQIYGDCCQDVLQKRIGRTVDRSNRSTVRKVWP
jgi:hypothetical protein